MRLPCDERDTIAAGLRQLDFLDQEIETIQRDVACFVLSCADARRLMSVPGVGMIAAAALLAHAGEITPLSNPRRLVGYLGLDPKVRQSGNAIARTGRISKEGAAIVRHVLVEAAHATVRMPGALRGFYQRVRARRGHQIAIVAVARVHSVLVPAHQPANATTPTRRPPPPPRSCEPSTGVPRTFL